MDNRHNDNSSLRKLVRETVSNIFEEKERTFNGMVNVKDTLLGEQVWAPLYYFLEHIFHEKNIDAADGFMFYGAYKATRFKEQPIFFQYRHGITRKYFWLDENGVPYDLKFELRPNLPLDWKKTEKDPYYLARFEKKSFEETFNYIYKDLINSIKKACEYNNCEIPEDSYLMSYSDYQILRDKMLDKEGYKVVTIKNLSDIKNFAKDIGEEN